MASKAGSIDPPTRITVLISGSGTNLQALIDASNTPALPNVEISRVISDRKAAYGLQRAAAAGIPTTVHGILPYKAEHPDPAPHPSHAAARAAYDADLARLVLADAPDIVVAVGFMRIVSPAFLEPLRAAGVPMTNLHPALHGDLAGVGCIERAWEEYGQGLRKRTGLMIHYVIAEVDMGEPIVQQEVEIEGCGSFDELRESMSAEEHKLTVRGTKVAIDRLREEKKGG